MLPELPDEQLMDYAIIPILGISIVILMSNIGTFFGYPMFGFLLRLL